MSDDPLARLIDDHKECLKSLKGYRVEELKRLNDLYLFRKMMLTIFKDPEDDARWDALREWVAAKKDTNHDLSEYVLDGKNNGRPYTALEYLLVVDRSSPYPHVRRYVEIDAKIVENMTLWQRFNVFECDDEVIAILFKAGYQFQVPAVVHLVRRKNLSKLRVLSAIGALRPNVHSLLYSVVIGVSDLEMIAWFLRNMSLPYDFTQTCFRTRICGVWIRDKTLLEIAERCCFYNLPQWDEKLRLLKTTKRRQEAPKRLALVFLHEAFRSREWDVINDKVCEWVMPKDLVVRTQ